MQNETDSKILAGLSALPELLTAVQRLIDQMNSIEKKMEHPLPTPPADPKKRVLRVKDVAEELSLSPAGVWREHEIHIIGTLKRGCFLHFDDFIRIFEHRFG